MAAFDNITKTLYCSGFQCPKMLWLKKYKSEEFDDSVMNQSILEAGTKVGELARGLFGDFSLVEYGDPNKMVKATEELISAGKEVIAEASFLYDGLFCSVDILKNLGNKNVELYEVKSSTHVNEIYLHDVSFQVYVLEKCGFTVQKASLVYINNKYIRGKELEIDKLFIIEDLTDTVRQMQSEVQERVLSLKECLSNSNEPQIDLGEYCFDPYDCGFWKYCSAHLPSPSVFDIANMGNKKKADYYKQGIITFEDVLNKAKLNNGQKLQVMHELEDLDNYIETDKIKEFLDTLTYPLYFLDFESFMSAIPPYENSWPDEQIPFQYSLHYIEKKGGTVKHKECLAYHGKDPRREVAERLCQDIPMNVCVLAYYMSFERGRIKELARLYPDLAEHLMNIHDNIHDLIIPFKQKQYYTKAMKGSASIKKVLPALFPNDPDLDYSSLEGVHKGDEASAAFIAMAKMTPDEVAVTRKNLKEYCKLDTYAMVKVLEKLQEVVG